MNGNQSVDTLTRVKSLAAKTLGCISANTNIENANDDELSTHDGDSDSERREDEHDAKIDQIYLSPLMKERSYPALLPDDCQVYGDRFSLNVTIGRKERKFCWFIAIDALMRE